MALQQASEAVPVQTMPLAPWADKTAAQIEQLIRRLAINAGGFGDASQQAKQHLLLGYYMRVLNSNIAGTHVGDADAVVEAMRHKLQQEQRDGDANSVKAAFLRLAREGGLRPSTQAAALQLLLTLSERDGPGGPRSIAAYQPLRVPKPVGVPPAIVSALADQRDQGYTGRPSSRPQSGFMGLNDPASRASSRPVSPLPVNGQTITAASEPVLVKDVLRAAAALPGTYTSYQQLGDMERGSLVVQAPPGEGALSRSQLALMRLLGELGLLFSTVQRHIDAGRSAGSVRQAFSAALQQEVADFYQLLALLERQLPYKLPAPGSSGADDTGPFLTLRRLRLWLAEPMRRMRLLAALADSTAACSGGQLAGVIWAHTQSGDPLSQAYITRVLHQVCVPLFDKIRVWVFEGRLEDPGREFFIVRTADQASAEEQGVRDPWHNAYRIEAAKLPPFLPQALAERVLRAGKSIDFLRDACGDVRWVQERAAAQQEVAAAVGFGQLEVLEAAVGEASAAVDKRLMELLHTRFALQRHCDAIRRYLLLGQGDFVVALIDALQTELSKKAAAVSEVAINHLMRQAVLASAARFDHEDTLERLRARKEGGAGGMERGWDVFILRYEVRGPLAAVFTPHAMSRYQQMFRLLWRLQLVQHGLDGTWSMLKVEVERELRKFRPNGQAHAAINALLRRCFTLRHEMSTLATFMQRYATFVVLEGEWQALQARMAAAGDLDSLIAAHEAFLGAVISKALLDADSQGVHAALQAVFLQMDRLAPLVHRLKDAVKAAVLSKDLRLRQMQANTAAGGWGSTSADQEQVEQEVDLSELADLGDALAALELAHGEAMGAFRQALAGKGHHELRFLLIPLDAAFASSGSWLRADSSSGPSAASSGQLAY